MSSAHRRFKVVILRRSQVLETHLPNFQPLIGKPGLQLLKQHELLRPLIERSLIENLTAAVEVSDELRTMARNGYCQQHSLPSEEALTQHINAKNLSEAQFDDQLLLPFRMNQLAREQFSAKAESRFLTQKERLDRVVYSLLRLENHSQALEFYLRIANQEANFSDIAGAHSLGNERNTNGVVGPSPLNQSHPILSEKLRASKPGQLLEPFRIDQWWLIARLEKFSPATFDEKMADQMSMELLKEWVDQETSRKLSELDLSQNGSAQS